MRRIDQWLVQIVGYGLTCLTGATPVSLKWLAGYLRFSIIFADCVLAVFVLIHLLTVLLEIRQADELIMSVFLVIGAVPIAFSNRKLLSRARLISQNHEVHQTMLVRIRRFRLFWVLIWLLMGVLVCVSGIQAEVTTQWYFGTGWLFLGLCLMNTFELYLWEHV